MNCRTEFILDQNINNCLPAHKHQPTELVTFTDLEFWIKITFTKTKTIKDRILKYIKNLFEHEEQENCYKPVRVSNFCNNNYIEYASNGDRNKTLSVEEHLNKIRPYLKDIINNLKKMTHGKFN